MILPIIAPLAVALLLGIRMPLKLTPELIAEAVEFVREGHFTETICKMLGINKDTWYSWYNHGEELCRNDADRDGLFDADEELSLYTRFYREVNKADAGFEMQMHNDILGLKHISQLWQHKMRLLEQKYPGRWRARQDFTLSLGEPVQKTMNLTEAQSLLEQSEKAVLETRKLLEQGARPVHAEIVEEEK